MTLDPRRLALVGYCGALLLLCALSSALIAPFFTTLFMGCLLAALTAPLHRRLRKRVGHGTSAALVTFMTFQLVLAPLGLILLGAAGQGREFAESMSSERGDVSLDGIARLAERLPGVEVLGGPEKLRAQIGSMARTGGKLASTAILKVVAAIPGALLVSALTLIACFFALKDGHKLIAWASKRVPLDESTRKAAWNAVTVTSVQTVWATLAAATAQSAVILIGFFALGIPLAWLAAVCTWVFAWIPFLGIVPVWAAGLIYLISAGAGAKIPVWFVFGVVGGIIDNFVRAWVLKGSARLHPIVALVAIFGGIKLFGIVGVFLGPTAAALTIALLDVLPEIRSAEQPPSEGTLPVRPADRTVGPTPPHAGTA